jgi:hypothetical protein
MEMHPEEIDAQVICAAIIAFGKEWSTCSW